MKQKSMKNAPTSPLWFMHRTAILAHDPAADELSMQQADVFDHLTTQLGRSITKKDYHRLKRCGLTPVIGQPPGLGQGLGKKPGLWTPREEHMFLGLCAIDDWYDEHRSCAIQAQIPVWLWLYAGSQFNITVEDIQSIMFHWASNERKLPVKIMQQTGIDLIDEWIGKDKDTFEGTRAVKRALREVYKEIQKLRLKRSPLPPRSDAYPPDLQKAIDILRYSFDDGLRSSKHATVKQQARYLITSILAYERCLDRLILPKDSPDSINKTIWHWARYFYHVQWPVWFQPLDVDLAHPASLSAAELLRKSCLALTSCLMFGSDPKLRQSLPERLQLDSLEGLHPDWWIRHDASTQTLIPSPFSMTDNQHFTWGVHLRIFFDEGSTISPTTQRR